MVNRFSGPRIDNMGVVNAIFLIIISIAPGSCHACIIKTDDTLNRPKLTDRFFNSYTPCQVIRIHPFCPNFTSYLNQIIMNCKLLLQ